MLGGRKFGTQLCFVRMICSFINANHTCEVMYTQIILQFSLGYFDNLIRAH